MASAGDRPKSRFLGFFGLDTRDKALHTLLWVSPYLLVLVGSLGGLSYGVHLFLPLPPWIYSLAILLALLYFFFFLARLRQLGLDAAEQEAEPPSGSA